MRDENAWFLNHKPSSLQQQNCSIEKDNGPGQWFVVYFSLWNFIIENCLEQFLSSLSQLKQFLFFNHKEQFLPKTGWSQESFYSLPTRKVKPILKTKGICLLFLFTSNLKALLFGLQADAGRYSEFWELSLRFYFYLNCKVVWVQPKVLYLSWFCPSLMSGAYPDTGIAHSKCSLIYSLVCRLSALLSQFLPA